MERGREKERDKTPRDKITLKEDTCEASQCACTNEAEGISHSPKKEIHASGVR
jgi:hypothetical protein